MKTKFKLFILLVASIIVVSLVSCDSDGYSLDDMYVSIATVDADESGYAKSFTLDGGTTLFVAASATNYKPTNPRVLINYTILSDEYAGYDHAIKLNYYMQDILTKPTVYVPADDKKGQDELGYDKINVATMFARAGYITIEYGINIGGKDKHLMNLARVSDSFVQDGDQPIKLQFRHNKEKDEEKYGSDLMLICFDIEDFVKANEGKKELLFEVSWEDYKGENKTMELKYPLVKSDDDKEQKD